MNENGIRTYDEWSSEDEELTEYQSFLSIRDEVLEKSSHIFDEVHEEFSSISFLIERFSEWKSKYPDEYNQVYCVKFFPLLCDPYVKVELLKWNMLNLDELALYETQWWKGLIDFDQGEGNDTNESEVVPTIIAKSIISKVKIVYNHIWEPSSTRQTRKAISILNEILDYESLRKINKEIQKIYMSVVMTLESSINGLLIINPPMNESNVEVKEFCERTFWKGIKLFNNTLLWANYIPSNTLKSLCFQNLLNSKLIPYLRHLSKEDAIIPSEKKIVISIQKSKILTENETSKDLALFIDYLKNLNKSTEESPRITQLLIALNAQNEVIEV